MRTAEGSAALNSARSWRPSLSKSPTIADGAADAVATPISHARTSHSGRWSERTETLIDVNASIAQLPQPPIGRMLRCLRRAAKQSLAGAGEHDILRVGGMAAITGAT